MRLSLTRRRLACNAGGRWWLQGAHRCACGHARLAGAALVSQCATACLSANQVAILRVPCLDFEAENEVFEADDDRAYMALQQARLDEPAPPGWPSRCE